MCWHQRRRRNEDCEFSQYFLANKSTEFQNACRCIGLANLMRLVRSVEVDQRQATTNSILVEATAWKNNPCGCLGYKLNLNSQISSSLRELEIAN